MFPRLLCIRLNSSSSFVPHRVLFACLRISEEDLLHSASRLASVMLLIDPNNRSLSMLPRRYLAPDCTCIVMKYCLRRLNRHTWASLSSLIPARLSLPSH